MFIAYKYKDRWVNFDVAVGHYLDDVPMLFKTDDPPSFYISVMCKITNDGHEYIRVGDCEQVEFIPKMEIPRCPVDLGISLADEIIKRRV